MKAAIVEAPGVLRVKTVSAPAPGEYEAVCELLYGALCTGTDRHLLRGEPPFCHWMTMPYILGHESIGRVVKTGPKVRHLHVGDLVTRVGCPAVDGISSGWGGFAEQGIAKDWQAMKEDGLDAARWESATVMQVLPSTIDPAEATMFITWRETLSYSKRMGVGAGSTVLVIGSGGNGLSFAAHARNLGARKIILLGAPNRQDEAMRAGATHVIDYKQETCWDAVNEYVGDGVDFAIDAVGKAGLADNALRMLADGGMLGIYGMDDAGQVRLNPSGARGTFSVYGGGYDEGEAHADVLAFYQAGKLDASIWLNLESPFSLETINEAFAAVENRTIVKPLVRLLA